MDDLASVGVAGWVGENSDGAFGVLARGGSWNFA